MLPADEREAARRSRKAFDPIAEAHQGTHQAIGLALQARRPSWPTWGELASDEAVAAVYDRRAAGRLMKQLDDGTQSRRRAIQAGRLFPPPGGWLQDRFPKAELQPVPGLVKLVDRKDIEAADWSLTPGRYVGVAPPEVDEDFDFEQTITRYSHRVGRPEQGSIETGGEDSGELRGTGRMKWLKLPTWRRSWA